MVEEASSPAQGVRTLAEALSPGTQPGGSWESGLPNYAALQLADGRALGVARLPGGAWVVSVVDEARVQSALLHDWSDKDVAHAVEALQRGPTRGPTAASPGDAQAGSRAATAPGPGAALPAERRDGLRESPAYYGQDPNAPPGFEDEHQIGPNAYAGPRIHFDPGQDLFPPGGANPRLGLDPLDPRNAMDGGRPRGGMQPAPFGSGPRPTMRWDPPNPF